MIFTGGISGYGRASDRLQKRTDDAGAGETARAEAPQETDFAKALKKGGETGGSRAEDNGYTVTSGSGLTLHCQKIAPDGSRGITAWVDAQTGTSISVYQPADFDEAHPVYRVELWDRDGNMTERMIDVSEVNLRSATTAEMFTCAAHLAKSGQQRDALVAFFDVRHRLGEADGSYDDSTARDWARELEERMREFSAIKFMPGYLRCKAFLEAMTGRSSSNSARNLNRICKPPI